MRLFGKTTRQQDIGDVIEGWRLFLSTDNRQQTLGMRFSLAEAQSIAEVFVISLRCFAPLREIF